MGRPRKRKYFTNITSMAISAYNKTDNPYLQNRIYTRFIHQSFLKLTENIVHIYKAYYFESTYEDFQNELVSYLIEKMPEYDSSRGRAYSWFTVVLRNHVIQTNDKNYKRLKANSYDVNDHDDNNSYKYHTQEIQNNEMVLSIERFIEYVDYNLYELFPDDTEARIAEAVIDIFRNRDTLPIYKKKYLYLLIRERTDLPTTYITKVVNKLYKIFNEVKNEVL